ncbi:MAG: DUF1080 domain-containing protein [Puniceicoccales bacterium]|nr:DUF1080 domain-containing protein [Puniceicoccales bacterium]
MSPSLFLRQVILPVCLLSTPALLLAETSLNDAVARLKNPAERTAAAQEIFSKCLPGKDNAPAAETGPGVIAPLAEALFFANSRENAKRVLDVVKPLQSAPSGTVPLPAPDADGFTPLFNGKNFDGWKGDTSSYFYSGDTLVVTRPSRQIETERKYRDFHLKFEHRLTPGTNNGIWLRGGFESQILDDTSPRYKGLNGYQYCGGIYGAIAPKTGHLKPLGEWNQEEIILDGRRVKVIMNGVVIIDADLDEAIAAAEKSNDGYGKPFLPGMKSPSGALALMSHSEHLEYRNMRIKELNTKKIVLSEDSNLSAWCALVGNPVSRAKMSNDELRAAQDKARPNMLKNWSCENGMIFSEGKGSNLCTKEYFGDFDMSLEWKISANSDSGVYLKGTPQVQIWDPANPNEKKNGADKGSGGLWNNSKDGKWPSVCADKPVGEWNKMRILMVGEKVSIWLNGQQVVNNARLDNYWARGKPLAAREQIELQAHNSPVWFRNVVVTPLD